MNKERLREILNDISSIKIAVVGDFCLDAYWFIDESMSEISVETGKATRPVSVQKYSLGGAGNVTANLAAMGVKEVHAFGVIGTDPFGNEMVRIMKEKGIITRNLLVQSSGWHTHTYSKPYIGDDELNRIDFGNFNRLTEETADRLIGNLVQTIPSVDLIIINQQVPSGIHTEYFRTKLIEVISSFPKKIFITDSRSFNDHFNGTIRKMNDAEALRLCGKTKMHDDPVSVYELEAAAGELFNRYAKPLLITRGSKGSVIIDEKGFRKIPGLLILSRTDTVGAGDSYLAGAASALPAGYSLDEAADLGTLVAGVTVQKLFQTGTASQQEILAIGSDPDYIFAPDLAENPRHAKYLENSEIEIINKWHKSPLIRHAIFDHDGTVSTLRQGWEKIMAPMMEKAILGEKIKTIDEAGYKRVKTRVADYIDRTTGIQTIVQMQGLVEMVREFGLVPGEKIMDARGYKKIYNDELILMVLTREKKYLDGELGIEDLTLKGAVSFLKILGEAGIKLYLASGTDADDVAREANVLGYDHLFEGRIYGSTGDIERDAKKIVLDQILDEIGESAGNRVITFGDGPVEIRETKKRGGLTVGVASDEVKRFGLNLQKRERLIKAGADMIVPDFSQSRIILQLLNL